MEMHSFSHQHVDTAHLIHELHPVRKQDSSASLDFIAFEKLSPLVFARSLLQLHGLHDLILHLIHSLIFRRSIPDVAEDFQGFVVSPVVVEPAG